jgi:hypothetical protein
MADPEWKHSNERDPSEAYSVETYVEFLRNGAFLSVRCGDDEASVIKALGPADDEAHPSRSGHILEWQSRHLQIGIYEGRVSYIGLYFRQGEWVPLPNLTVSKETTPEDLRRWLRAEGIPWEESHVAGHVRLALRCGVEAAFDDETFDEGEVFDSFQTSR